MTKWVAWVLVLSSLLAAAGQIFLKSGANGRAGIDMVLNKHVVLGLSCYLVGLILWITGLSKAPLSAVYPFTFITFVAVTALSFFVLNERPSATMVAGWILICAGIGLCFIGAGTRT